MEGCTQAEAGERDRAVRWHDGVCRGIEPEGAAVEGDPVRRLAADEPQVHRLVEDEAGEKRIVEKPVRARQGVRRACPGAHRPILVVRHVAQRLRHLLAMVAVGLGGKGLGDADEPAAGERDLFTERLRLCGASEPQPR